VRDWILDPGFGFSKSIEDNYRLFKGLPELKKCGRKILVGISRKRMIYQPLGITPEESLEAVTALHLQALLAGADILRVHDVAAARGCVTLYDFLK
jgi:dihydropteroate synthase